MNHLYWLLINFLSFQKNIGNIIIAGKTIPFLMRLLAHSPCSPLGALFANLSTFLIRNVQNRLVACSFPGLECLFYRRARF